jgi:hypothetical protein
MSLIRYQNCLYTPYRSKSRRTEFRGAVTKLWRDLGTAIRYLNERGVDPVVVGGLAVQHHGVERLTEDIDLLISRAAYDELVQEGKIKFGQLKIMPGTQIDVLTEGKDRNPDPEFVRDADTVFPTFAGLIYLKLNAGRMKDVGDVAELLKAHGFDAAEKETILAFLPSAMRAKFGEIWDNALREHEHVLEVQE